MSYELEKSPPGKCLTCGYGIEPEVGCTCAECGRPMYAWLVDKMLQRGLVIQRLTKECDMWLNRVVELTMNRHHDLSREAALSLARGIEDCRAGRIVELPVSFKGNEK